MGKKIISKDNTLKIAVITAIASIAVALITGLIPVVANRSKESQETVKSVNDSLTSSQPIFTGVRDSLSNHKTDPPAKNKVILDHSDNNTVIQGDSNTNTITLP